jgi:signal transduction histidine kinase
VDGVRRAGMIVDVRVDGTTREVPATVDLAAYRIVQEALTNAVKHSPDHPVTVHLSYAPSSLRVDVGDAGTSGSVAAEPAPGFGLTGLRERTRAVGGSLAAGPTTDGGFRVVADLPTA